MFIYYGDKEVLITGDNTFITKEDFIKRFGNNFEYETLINHENTTDVWKDRFYYLKSTGILN